MFQALALPLIERISLQRHATVTNRDALREKATEQSNYHEKTICLRFVLPEVASWQTALQVMQDCGCDGTSFQS